MPNLICPRCNGAGRHSPAFDFLEEADGLASCHTCDGQGDLPPLDEAAIRRLIFGRRNVARLRSSRPDRAHASADRVVKLNCERAYYVWRMARFHGGVDVTLPIMAAIGMRDDPAREDLDRLADVIAREAFGSDLRGAARWGRALGYLP